jgi:tRNA A-37 threonylcarbamoyl transferase component Bud32
MKIKQRIATYNTIATELTLLSNKAIRDRLESSQSASAEIVLFLEYFPENVHDWLAKELKKDAKSAESACSTVEKNLSAATSFMNAQGLLHFDAHFWNILTDGESLYFSDFGLAISSRFDLSEAEMDFFKEHCLFMHNGQMVPRFQRIE